MKAATRRAYGGGNLAVARASVGSLKSYAAVARWSCYNLTSPRVSLGGDREGNAMTRARDEARPDLKKVEDMTDDEVEAEFKEKVGNIEAHEVSRSKAEQDKPAR